MNPPAALAATLTCGKLPSGASLRRMSPVRGAPAASKIRPKTSLPEIQATMKLPSGAIAAAGWL